MKRLLFFIFLSHFFCFSQNIVSEFPIGIKHELRTNKSTGEKWIPTETSNYLNKFSSQLYSIDKETCLLFINKINKTSIFFLNSQFTPTDFINITPPKDSYLLDVSVKSNKVTIFFWHKRNPLSKTYSFTKFEYNLSLDQLEETIFKFKPKRQKVASVFAINNELIIITSSSFSNKISIYKHGKDTFDKVADYDLKELEYKDANNFNRYANEYLLSKYLFIPTISGNNIEPFSITTKKSKIYLNKTNNSFILTVDDDNSKRTGTHKYEFDIDSDFSKNYKHYPYSIKQRAKHNSYISNNQLLQLSVSSQKMNLKVISLSDNSYNNYTFNKKDSIFRDTNTYYGQINNLNGLQKEKTKINLKGFLSFVSKSDIGISSIFYNNKHHILLGGRKDVNTHNTLQNHYGKELLSSFSNKNTTTLLNNAKPLDKMINPWLMNKYYYKSSFSFDNYTQLSIDKNDNLSHSIDLKKSTIFRLNSSPNTENTIKLKSSIHFNGKYYLGYYDSLKKKFIIEVMDTKNPGL